MLKDDVKNRLLQAAAEAREQAYAPYSNNFRVGAAVLTKDGSIFTGCNIENSLLGATVCAERVAIFKAVSSGYRRIDALAVVAEYSEPIPPCGLCLQVISEFSRDAAVIMANTAGATKLSSIKELLPLPFKLPHVDGQIGAVT